MPDALPPFPESDDQLAKQIARANLTGDPLGYGLAMVVRAVRELRAVAARLGPAIPPEAVEAAAASFAERAEQRMRASFDTQAKGATARARWTAAGAVACVGLVALGVGYAAGRHGRAAEVRLVEQGLALSLPAGSAWLGIIRNNPDGAAVLAGAQRWTDKATGRQAAAVPVWLDAAPVPRMGKR